MSKEERQKNESDKNHRAKVRKRARKVKKEQEQTKKEQEQTKKEHKNKKARTKPFSEIEKNLAILGLTELASQSEVRKAFLSKALEFHPDKNSTDTTMKMQEINKAHAIVLLWVSKTL